MCDSQGQPASVADALGMLDHALGYLVAADAAALPAAVQADVLLALAKAEARQTAAQGRVLAAFAAQGGYEDDGHGSARTWLRWRARVTSGAAAGAIGWMRRLTAHPVIAAALGAGALSESWARQICEWSDRLPEAQRGTADEILAAAARGGADLAGLVGLAQEMYERSHRDEADGIFDDRYLRLGITFRGAGRAEGDLTPGCAAALDAVLEALGQRAGPEDTRTSGQRRHDALEEACTRLIASGMLPGGQPARVQLHITLAQLRDAPGASQVEDAWAAARASQPGWLSGAGAAGAACDATLTPIVTGHVDWLALDRFTEAYLASHGLAAEAAGTTAVPHATTAVPGATPAVPHGTPAVPGATPAGPGATPPVLGGTGTGDVGDGQDGAGGDGARTGPGTGSPGGCACTCGGCRCRARRPLSPETRQRLRATMLRLAADVLSGPGGLASWLRRSELGDDPGGGPSLPLGIPLPLDTGEAGPSVPAHLRRAVTTRHIHCAFPGCRVPASACHIHHLVPRACGGPTALGNLLPLCTFHHLTAVHRWGWALTLHADGGVSATSPDRARTLRDHGPPTGPRSRARLPRPVQRPAQRPWAAQPSRGPDPLRSPDGQRPAPLPVA